MSEAKDELNRVSQPETIFRSAIEVWWRSKERNARGGKSSQGGTRDANLAGDTMDGFRDTLVRILIDHAGVDPTDIFSGGHLSQCPSNLPSYFRASKNWDIVVCKRALLQQLRGGRYDGSEKLVAAIEFKSQYESIGNNQNNRIEESIGNAEDFWASYENNNFFAADPATVAWISFRWLLC
jgi:hypothetical protein